MADAHSDFAKLMTGDCERTQAVYKTVGSDALKLHIFNPPEKRDAPRPGILFFHGGGWKGGTPQQFFPPCHYFARRGMVAMSAEYRLGETHGVSPFQCVADARSAMRWVLQQRDALGIAPGRLAAGGGSAGGHLAACLAFIEEPADEAQGPALACMLDALVLLNPVLDTSPAGYGYNVLRDQAEALSPLCHVRPGMPPTLIAHGTADTTTPIAGIEQFQSRMQAAGNRCELIRYEGRTHGFFNPKGGTDWQAESNADFVATTLAIDRFLQSTGLLDASAPGE